MGPASDVSFGVRGGTPIAFVRREIDLSNAGAIGASIAGCLSNQEFGLVVDLTEVSYVDSAGIRMLFQLLRRLEEHRQDFTVVIPRGSLVRRSLEVGGLLASVSIVESLSELENADRG